MLLSDKQCQALMAAIVYSSNEDKYGTEFPRAAVEDAIRIWECLSAHWEAMARTAQPLGAPRDYQRAGRATTLP